jgi:predicted ribosomally synthesized peptide with nif11-like leader
MSLENVKAFLVKVTTDDSLVDQLRGVSNPGDRLRIAREVGYDFTPEEFDTYLQTLEARLESEELADEDLEEVAGGLIEFARLRNLKSIEVIYGTGWMGIGQF